MEHKYLKKWVEEQEIEGWVCKFFGRYQDQYGLFFKKRKEFLQVNLASEDCFCFMTDQDRDRFVEDRDLPHINHIISGAKVESMELLQNDRIITLSLSKLDLTGAINHYVIILELIPHFENIIVVEVKDDNDWMILNSIKKFSFAENPQRQILPGVLYQSPLSNYQIVAEEITYPLSINDKGRISAVTENCKKISVINLLLKSLYYDYILNRRQTYKRQAISSKLNKEIDKNKRKLVKLQQELEDSSKVDLWQQKAELLKGCFNQIKQGMDAIVVTNYYDEGFPEVEITLKKELSPQENINYYFKKYRKARDGKDKILEQIKLTENDIKRLNDEIQILSKMSSDELDELKKKPKGKQQQVKSKYRSIAINQDWEIIVGRTSSENDFITTRLARSWDWWFHTRIFKGTHVILRNFSKKDLPEELKMICCQLAAYFSKAKKSTNVPVDYTEIRYVRKPRKSPPGYVIYTDQKTLYVDPISMRDAVEKVKDFVEQRRNNG